MRRMSRFVLAFLLLIMSLPVLADDKPLPRVLVIGDSVYSQHARHLPKDLKGRATVVFANWPKGVVPNSTHALKHLDQLLGRAGKTDALGGLAAVQRDLHFLQGGDVQSVDLAGHVRHQRRHRIGLDRVVQTQALRHQSAP